MTRHQLIEALDAYAALNDPWNPDHRERLAVAEAELLATVQAGAEAGDPDALRVWQALSEETTYAASNVGSPMHRSTPYYAPIVDLQRAIMRADDNPPTASDETAWCSQCRKRRVVEEVDPTASTYEGHHELGWTNTHLACGHTEQTEPRVIGSSPGGEAAAEAMAQDATRRRMERTYVAYDGGL